MRILYILHATIMGGATISFIDMVKGLKEKGVEPIIVCPPGLDKDFKKIVEQESFEYHTVDLVPSILNKYESRYWFYKTHFKAMLRSIKQLVKIIYITKPDIIHTNTGVEHEGFLCSKLMHIPHVWHIREYQDYGLNWHVLPSKVIFCWMLKLSWVITITNDLKKHFKLTKCSKVFTVYDGVLSKKDIVLNPYKDDYFLIASRIAPQKGIDDAIRAFCKFSQEVKKFKLIIMGGGNSQYVDTLKELSKELKCEESVIFTGYQSIENVIQYMRKSTALIASSHFEGLGRMTAEAALSGCYVIGRNNGGTKEIIEQIGGDLFNNIDELVSSMKKVANLSLTDYKKMIEDTQKKAILMFTNEYNVDNTYMCYKNILSK